MYTALRAVAVRAGVASVVLASLTSCGPTENNNVGSNGAPPISPAVNEPSAASVDAQPPTTVNDSGDVTESTLPTLTDIVVAQRLLPAVDLAAVAAAELVVDADGFTVRATPGLPLSESIVGNDLCLVLAAPNSDLGRICANSTDIGGLLPFTQDWAGGVAAAVLTSAGVTAIIENCGADLRSASTAAATITVCPSMNAVAGAVDFRLQSGSDAAIMVSMPVLAD